MTEIDIETDHPEETVTEPKETATQVIPSSDPALLLRILDASEKAQFLEVIAEETQAMAPELELRLLLYCLQHPHGRYGGDVLPLILKGRTPAEIEARWNQLEQLDQLLFHSDYSSWGWWEDPGYDEKEELSKRVWLMPEALQQLLPLIAEVQPLILESANLYQLLRKSVQDFFLHHILHYFNHLDVYPVSEAELRALQARALHALATVLLAVEPDLEEALQMEILYHTRTPEGDPQEALALSRRLKTPPQGFILAELMWLLIPDPSNVEWAMKLVQDAIADGHAWWKAHSREQKWWNIEGTVFKAIRKDLPDDQTLNFARFAEAFCEREERSLHFRVYYACYSADRFEEILMELMLRLPVELFFDWSSSNYIPQDGRNQYLQRSELRIVDPYERWGNSYLDIGYLQHLQIVAAFPFRHARCPYLQAFVERWGKKGGDDGRELAAELLKRCSKL